MILAAVWKSIPRWVPNKPGARGLNGRIGRRGARAAALAAEGSKREERVGKRPGGRKRGQGDPSLLWQQLSYRELAHVDPFEHHENDLLWPVVAAVAVVRRLYGPRGLGVDLDPSVNQVHDPIDREF
jgi:hypothetical protein